MRLWCAVCFIASVIFCGSAYASDEWLVVQNESSLEFSVEIEGLVAKGTFERWHAKIQFDPTRPEEARLQVSIQMPSVSIADPRGRGLKNKSWLSVETHPTAVFEATGFDWTPETGALRTTGTLTLKGISVPLTLAGDLVLDGTIGKADLSGTIVRSDHKVGAQDDPVSSRVQVITRVVAHLKKTNSNLDDFSGPCHISFRCDAGRPLDT